MMKDNSKKFLSLALALTALLTGCSTVQTDTTEETNADTSLAETAAETTTAAETSTVQETDSAAAEAVQTVSNLQFSADAPYSIDTASLFTDRDLRGDYEETASITLNGTTATSTDPSVKITGSTVTITAEGTYLVSGTLDDGQIIVDADGAKVQLVFANANITSKTAAPVVVRNAKKVFLTLADGTVNTLTSTASIDETAEDAENAVIYSRETLTINGTGTLNVNDSGTGMNGITSKDELTITGGTITVNTAGNGVKGKDFVAIADGTLTVNAGEDGIKATNATDAGMGFVFICGGTITVNAAEDGIQAETELAIEGGEVNITAGGGTVNAPQHTDDFGMGGGMMGGGRGGRGDWGNMGGEMPADGEFQPQMGDGQSVPTAMNMANIVTAENSQTAADPQTTDENDLTSVKGLKAGTLLYIGGGSVTVDAADDALHSNGELYLAGGTQSLAAGSKGVHADTAANITGGSLTITESYEGIEAAYITVSGGELSVTASDDGFNASDGSSQGAMGGAVNANLTISGGNVYVNAGGDGLDSNGEMLISGGTIYVDGPTNSGNGSLDSNSTLTCTGGLLVAAGASGMAEYPTGTQETIILTTTETQAAGSEVVVTDAQGNTVLTYTPSKTWNSLVVSSADFTQGETYTFTVSGNDAGSVTLDSTVCYIGQAGGMMGGQRGGFGQGQMPEGDFQPGQMPGGDFEMPTDENGNMIPPEGGHGGMRGQFQQMQ